MANYNIEIKKRNPANTGWDNMYPVTRAANVIAGNGSNLESHVTDNNNPHTVTKAQVGLSSVQNYSVASQAEAEAGTTSSRYMTPQRTKQAIEAQVKEDFNEHLAEGAIDDVHNLLANGNIIQEVGNNANGKYIRFADGTQICRHNYSINISAGATTTIDWVYPAGFYIDLPALLIGPGMAGTSIHLVQVGFNTQGAANTVEKAQIVLRNSHTNTLTVGAGVCAIGRWK